MVCESEDKTIACIQFCVTADEMCFLWTSESTSSTKESLKSSATNAVSVERVKDL
jgi:hypothetical protein